MNLQSHGTLEDFAPCAEVSREADTYDLSFGKGHFEAAKAKVTGTGLKFSLGRDVLKRGIHKVFREFFFNFFLFFVALGIEKGLIVCSSVVWMFLVQK